MPVPAGQLHIQIACYNDAVPWLSLFQDVLSKLLEHGLLEGRVLAFEVWDVAAENQRVVTDSTQSYPDNQATGEQERGRDGAGSLASFAAARSGKRAPVHRLFRSRGSLPGLKLKGVPATVGIKQACALHHK